MMLPDRGSSLTRRRLLTGLAGAALAGCAQSVSGQRWGDELTPLYAYPARDEWPDPVRALPPSTQAAYRYAVANAAVLRYMPCFCGCVNGGHTSNYDCYVREEQAGGRIRLDTHGFG